MSGSDNIHPKTAGLCVFYLARRAEGREPIVRFFEAWRRHPFGYPHRLIIIAKGWESDTNLSDIPADLLPPASCVHHVSDAGLDVDTYCRVGREYSAEYSLFLNTFSEPLVDNWGYLMMAHAGKQRLIGVTGNWESPSISSRPLRQLFRRGIIGVPWKSLKALWACCFWPVYPNPALRTNAFMVPLDLLYAMPIPIGRKRNAVIFECGRRGLSRRAVTLGYELFIIGKDGLAYGPQDWPSSRIFRSGGQANLLVADNRTREYDNAEPSRRREMEILTWGKVVSH